MVATIRKNGGPVWYLLANDEGHGFAKKKNQDFQFYATVVFISDHGMLGGCKPVPEPTLAALRATVTRA